MTPETPEESWATCCAELLHDTNPSTESLADLRRLFGETPQETSTMRLELAGGSKVEKLYAWDARFQRGLALVRMQVKADMEIVEVDIESLRLVTATGTTSFPESVAEACEKLAMDVIGRSGEIEKPVLQMWTATA